MNFIKTPNEMLLEQAGIPHLAEGRSVGDLQAEMIAQGHTPQRFANGKSVGPQQKSIVFNVGKDVNGVKNVLSHDQILSAMKNLGFEPQHAHVVFAQPHTEFGPHEDTLVVKAKGNPQDLHMKTHILSEHLSQDAIPAKLEGATSGVLAGPKAGDWGPYDPRRFVEHGSTTAAGNNPSILQEAYTKAKTALTPSIQTQEALGKVGNALKPVAKYAGLGFGLLGAGSEIADAAQNVQKGNNLGTAENLINLGAFVAPIVPMSVIQGGLDLAKRSAAMTANNPAYREQMTDMSNTDLGGALSGDAGLAAQIMENAKK